MKHIKLFEEYKYFDIGHSHSPKTIESRVFKKGEWRSGVMKIAKDKMKISEDEFEELERLVRRNANNPLIFHKCDHIENNGYYNLMMYKDYDEQEAGRQYILNLLYFEQEDDYVLDGKNFKTIGEVIDHLKASYVSLQDEDEIRRKRYRTLLRGKPYDNE